MPIELQRRRPPSELLPGKAALRLISEFEGLSLKSYPDPATGGDPWTAGYGHTGPDVQPGMAITLKQADDWLAADIEKAAGIVRANVFVALTQGEFDALCSLAFNLGYIPRSLKACLNGGLTDKNEKMEPGSYGSALKQFPRNCRAAGMPMRGLLRRRLAEACVYSDLPWEAACSINLIRLKCDAKGNIDPIETTSLEDTLERARQDVPMARPPIDVTKPWPVPPRRDVEASLAPLPDSLPGPSFEGIPTQLPLPSPVEDEDELFLDTPEAPIATDAKGSPPVSEPPSPSSQAAVPSHVNETAKSEHDEGVVSKIPPNLNTNPASSVELSGPGAGPAAAEKVAPRPSAPPVPIPAPAPPKPPPVIAPKSIDIKSIPYGEMDPEQPPKNMTDSRRVIGMVVVGAGSLVQILAAREIVSSSVGAIFFDMSRDPVVVALFAGACMWVVGWLTRKRGTHIVAKGMAEARTVLK